MTDEEFVQWRCGSQTTPLVMGILNVTPDSFADTGRYVDHEQAMLRAREMVSQGVDIIDIGGESSRPGARSVSIDEEMQRVIPLIEKLHKEFDVCLSIDTVKPEIMVAAVQAGAGFINDINALTHPSALNIAKKLQVPICLMHKQGDPETMQQRPVYTKGVVEEVMSYLRARVDACLQAGIPKTSLIIDPGFGFGKTSQHNLQLMKHLQRFKQLECPILLGVSRKATLGELLNKPPSERLVGSIALTSVAILHGASIIRTHDIEETKQALLVANAIMQSDNSIDKDLG